MENLESIKNKLILAIQASADRNLLFKIWDLMNNEIPAVKELPSFYETEKPMTDAEVDEYFKEEKVELHPVYMKMITRGLEDIQQGRVYTEEEIDKMDEEWLN